MADLATVSEIERAPRWARRYTVLALLFFATLLCYLDRVSISVAIISLAKAEHYAPTAQGVVLSAFFWGYIWTQLLGGWLSDRFGGKRVLAAGVAIWSLATFLTPAAAGISFVALCAMRVLLGFGEGVNFPAIYSLIARWMPVRERGRAISINASGMHLGTVTALLLSPRIVVALGWRALFYITGAVGIFWLAAWMARAADRPESDGSMSASELSLITQERAAAARIARVPWRSIVHEPAVWAIVLAHFCSNFGFNILLLWLPTYLHHTFGVEIGRVGLYALMPWIATFAVVNAAGWIADSMIGRGVRVSTTRKLMQSAAFGFGALPLIALPAAASPLAATLMITSSASATGLGLAAYGVNHLDVGPNYAGVLMGVSNTVATIPGIIGVALTGIIVETTGSFSAVFYLIAAVYTVGLAGYVTWARGDRRL